MSDEPATPPPAGFYPDPDGALRWWDGAQWTDQIQEAPSQGVHKGKLIGGIVLLLLVLVNLSNRAQTGASFANGAEASGYLLALALFVAGGIWLIVSATRRR